MRQKKSPWLELGKRSSALRKNLEKIVQEAADYADEENSDAISGGNTLTGEIKKWDEVVRNVQEKVREISSSLDRRREEQLESFHQRLIRLITDRGHEVYGETSPLIVDGIVHIDTNLEKKGKVLINGRSVDDLSQLSIASKVEAEIDRIGKNITPPEQMIRDLLAAYEILLRKNGQPFGTQLESTTLQFQIFMKRQPPAFAENPSLATFQEYPREVYRAELYILLKSGLSKLNGKKFRYASGSDTNGAVFMMVPALGRTAHVGRMWFEEEAD